MMKTVIKLFIFFALHFLYTLSFGQMVNNATELNNAINAAMPGTTITLSDGHWNNVFIDIDKNGTEAEPITITAQNAGAVFMTGNSRVYMEGSYLIVSGLVFKDPVNLVGNSSEIEPVIELKRCDYCKVINNKIDHYNAPEFQKSIKFKWILTDGQYNEIAYNSFIGKYGVGSIINDNRNSSSRDYLSIHHNYFADRTPINGVNDDNDQDAIRIGNSSTSLGDSYTEVYENYFYNFFGEVEIISNKSGNNKYYNNTFRDYSGTLTLRHGDDCEVYGNYFFAEENPFSGGIRVIGEGHKVYNNYIEGVNSFKAGGSLSNATGGINVSNGRTNSALNGYYQVRNAQIVNNTFVNCDYALRVGTKVSSDLDEEPVNLIVANNIMYNTGIEEYQIVTEPSGFSKSEGNILSLSNSAMVFDGDVYRLTNDSAPIDASVGNYSYVTEDIFGGERDGNVDAGAEEFGSNGTNLPYTSLDVGVKVGFGVVSNPSLSTSPSMLTFGISGGTQIFEVISNVDWTITEDLSWLNIEETTGFGSKSISVTVAENTTGVERSGTISISENTGGNDLSTEIMMVQLNTFVPSEIPIVATSSQGMQIKDEVSEENAYDDNFATYWTGDPDTEPEVSITFDLGCRHTLTEIGINFWKANERSTTFSIAVSDDAGGPYTVIVDTETSADTGASVETEQIFSMNNTIGRYVKFIGIGNSSSTNWTSIANVNIYGDLRCENSTAVVENMGLNQDVRVYPIPARDGTVNIASDSKALHTIDIYNSVGQQVFTLDAGGRSSKQIDVSQLDTGIYFIKLESLGVAKILIQK